MKGYKQKVNRSYEHRRKISEIHKGKIVSDEQKEKVSKSLKSYYDENGHIMQDNYKRGEHPQAKGCYIVVSGVRYEYQCWRDMGESMHKKFGFSKRGVESTWKSNGIPDKYAGIVTEIGDIECKRMKKLLKW